MGAGGGRRGYAGRGRPPRPRPRGGPGTLHLHDLLSVHDGPHDALAPGERHLAPCQFAYGSKSRAPERRAECGTGRMIRYADRAPIDFQQVEMATWLEGAMHFHEHTRGGPRRVPRERGGHPMKPDAPAAGPPP